jgi:hypothetical protein
MKRIKLRFVPNLNVEFADRDVALRRVVEWAERGTYPVQVVFGPEGCGKTAWLKQSAALLRELGFEVVYINPIEMEVLIEVGVKDVKERLLEILREATDAAWARASWALIELVKELIRAGKRRLAVLADDVFQVIGLNKAAMYVKGLLGLIEYPPKEYEVLVAAVATSEGLSRREIGRHRWADIRSLWNMSEEGFKQLYDQIPGEKPDFKEVWRITGGNPALLAELYGKNWDAERVVKDLIDRKRLKAFLSSLSPKELELLVKAVNDPDLLMSRDGIQLMDKLVEMNLLVDTLPRREPQAWIDMPPPEKDPILGIGRYVAWQTPLHREAVRRALECMSS